MSMLGQLLKKIASAFPSSSEAVRVQVIERLHVHCRNLYAFMQEHKIAQALLSGSSFPGNARAFLHTSFVAVNRIVEPNFAQVPLSHVPMLMDALACVECLAVPTSSRLGLLTGAGSLMAKQPDCLEQLVPLIPEPLEPAVTQSLDANEVLLQLGRASLFLSCLLQVDRYPEEFVRNVLVPLSFSVLLHRANATLPPAHAVFVQIFRLDALEDKHKLVPLYVDRSLNNLDGPVELFHVALKEILTMQTSLSDEDHHALVLFVLQQVKAKIAVLVPAKQRVVANILFMSIVSVSLRILPRVLDMVRDVVLQGNRALQQSYSALLFAILSNCHDMTRKEDLLRWYTQLQQSLRSPKQSQISDSAQDDPAGEVVDSA
eukprot:TRINITY_DN3573_c0_g3_i1.p1 TRINITY_DN3573_c0_g3~~TRINITY_DN3573_c0_g3_i1.p1  ORF type:complete len:436 (-),score=107.47 TRINITY_DN3573_c0_g3_i1:577-1698(-)